MIYTHLITFAATAIMAFWVGVEFNQQRVDAHEKQKLEQAALDQQELSRLEQARSRAALGAQVLARQSEARLRSDAAASQRALVSLQHSADEAMRAAATSETACRTVSATLSELFVASAGAYRGMAEKADECVIDLRTQLDTP